jgi:hypothetical protein
MFCKANCFTRSDFTVNLPNCIEEGRTKKESFSYPRERNNRSSWAKITVSDALATPRNRFFLAFLLAATKYFGKKAWFLPPGSNKNVAIGYFFITNCKSNLRNGEYHLPNT